MTETIDFTRRRTGPKPRFTAEELRLRRNERNILYYYKNRDKIIEKNRMKRLKANGNINQENIDPPCN